MPSDAGPTERRPLRVRLAWFVLLWLASVTAVGLLSLAIKWALK